MRNIITNRWLQAAILVVGVAGTIAYVNSNSVDADTNTVNTNADVDQVTNTDVNNNEGNTNTQNNTEVDTTETSKGDVESEKQGSTMVIKDEGKLEIVNNNE